MRYEGGDRSFAEAVGDVMHHALQLPDATLLRLGHRPNFVYSVCSVNTSPAIVLRGLGGHGGDQAVDLGG